VNKLKYLNVGCGSKFHKLWVNIDMASSSEDVISANLLKGIPFPDNSFDVLFHSHVLEHFPKEKAPHFLKECFRVLKPEGIIRIVVPDLENIVDEYKRLLKANLENPNDKSQADYDWILLEMYDQTVRNVTGGMMAEYFRKPEIINEEYVFNRIGYVARDIRNEYLRGEKPGIAENIKKMFLSRALFVKGIKVVLKKTIRKIFPQTEASKIGNFRLDGEIHYWMYDSYSLGKLLKDCGFKDISIKTPFESDIPNWSEYELDVKGGIVNAPNSLFVEARKKSA